MAAPPHTERPCAAVCVRLQGPEAQVAAAAATLLSTMAMTDEFGDTIRNIATALVTDECETLFQLKAKDVVAFFLTDNTQKDSKGRVWDAAARERLSAYLTEQLATIASSVRGTRRTWHRPPRCPACSLCRNVVADPSTRPIPPCGHADLADGVGRRHSPVGHEQAARPVS